MCQSIIMIAGLPRQAPASQQRMSRWTPCLYIGCSLATTWLRSSGLAARLCLLSLDLSYFRDLAMSTGWAARTSPSLSCLKAMAFSPCNTFLTGEPR